MKTATDPRHISRINSVKELFADTYTSQTGISELTKKVLEKKDIIDNTISDSAPEWPIDKLNRIDLAILRLGVYELEYGDAPAKVIIDEAVELGKLFGSENTSSFVNGVLGSVLKGKGSNEQI
ncbi:MAG: N utilization substance protein B-like protein [Candidatus Woesebacteria bacterium GW2011_GWA1_37_8]|uniref:N utilization substance protein B-like protein n=2 Tax=Candidatus Woeseibacteriota TaxID=1752722 RepID=A0A0G0PCK7_9BACT|nr:MAG: N utilization substance protein B-like protein [Microgenomates group bacterium GW2011_GWC1_37_12b]KKQ43679.1 MAG: N utilization substance protein B-like protein [Candidatus Woesebacteria bacterium GW2011_GWA1_37_8]KKQ87016.1 MAG: N utilization substance protein B-like protein [Candidatus Woesebacteria bacterium GW2011_GWB1_38_8b]